jgi:hypothetical protein
MTEAEAGVGGKLRFLLARRVDLRLAIRQVREDGFEALRGRLRQVAGLQRAGDGKVRDDVDDPVHGMELAAATDEAGYG